MSKQLALKIDVDTWLGTRAGVPRLMALLKKYNASATFLFSLGPDHTGRAIKRVFRPGFLSKVSRTSVVEHYGIRTLLYGTLLPGPDIGRREAALMRLVRDEGFEVGIHCWDHIRWQDDVANKDAKWTQREMRRAADRFETIFGEPAKTHGAAGWQMNEAAYRYQKELGFYYASDTRGSHPYLPVDRAGEVIGVPQIPTTLPTLDELLGLDNCNEANADDTLLQLTQSDNKVLHVYTLHAELEGLKLLPVFERLLVGWKKQGYRLVTCADAVASLDITNLPRHYQCRGEISGRSGKLELQGPAFLGSR